MANPSKVHPKCVSENHEIVYFKKSLNLIFNFKKQNLKIYDFKVKFLFSRLIFYFYDFTILNIYILIKTVIHGRKKNLQELQHCYGVKSQPQRRSLLVISLRLFSINLCLCLQDFKSRPKCFATSLFQTNFPRRSRFCFPCFNRSDVSRVLPGIVLTTAIISSITSITSSLAEQVSSQPRRRRYKFSESFNTMSSVLEFARCASLLKCSTDRRTSSSLPSDILLFCFLFRFPPANEPL